MASSFGPYSEVLWHIVLVAAPALLRHCSACGQARSFRSSGRFRVNASGRRLDVWLLYRCTTCDATYKLPVHERTSVRELGDRLSAYERNDPRLAEACACDPRLVARSGAAPLERSAYRVERPPFSSPAEIRLALPRLVRVRLDRLLSTELGWPRAEPGRLAEAGRLLVLDAPSTLRALRRTAVDGQRIRIVQETGAPTSTWAETA